MLHREEQPVPVPGWRRRAGRASPFHTGGGRRGRGTVSSNIGRGGRCGLDVLVMGDPSFTPPTSVGGGTRDRGLELWCTGSDWFSWWSSSTGSIPPNDARRRQPSARGGGVLRGGVLRGTYCGAHARRDLSPAKELRTSCTPPACACCRYCIHDSTIVIGVPTPSSIWKARRRSRCR